MPFKLNHITLERGAEQLKKLLDEIENYYVQEPPADDYKVYHRYLEGEAETYLDAGLLAYQQEKPAEEIRRLFQKAAEVSLKEVACRQAPEPNESRNLWDMEILAAVVIGFGGSKERGEFARLTEEKYLGDREKNYPAAPDQKAHDTLLAYVGVLKKAASGKLAASDCDALINLIQSLPNAARDNTVNRLKNLSARPAVLALKAILEKDEKAFNAALADVVAHHKNSARRGGELKLSRKGLMCLSGMLLAKLALEQGLVVLVRSEYLPLGLLET